MQAGCPSREVAQQSKTMVVMLGRICGWHAKIGYHLIGIGEVISLSEKTHYLITCVFKGVDIKKL